MSIWLKKFLWFIFTFAAVGIITSKMGFQQVFINIFWVYTTAGFLLYVLLDLPPLKEPKSKAGKSILLLLTFMLFSGIYTGVSALLPQFDPKIEIERINKPPYVPIEAGPELIAAGKDIFLSNKCVNCHKADKTGSSDRGPDMDLWQFGLRTLDELKEDIVDPRKKQALGFEDPKSKKAMPTYFGEEISKGEFTALFAFISTLWNKENMPVRGKVGSEAGLVPWDEDPEIIALGKKVFEGETYTDLFCAGCHGKDGVSLMDGARDLRNPQSVSRNHDRKLKDWTDADWFKSVSLGVPPSPMMAWLEDYPPKAIWLAIAYAKQFHKQPENQKLPAPEELEPVHDLW
jgi:mono/diheme cytochrome c family protein